MKKYWPFLSLIPPIIATILVTSGCGPAKNSTIYPQVQSTSSSFTMFHVPTDDRFGRFLDIEPDTYTYTGNITAKYMTNDGTTETAIIYNRDGEIQYGYQFKLK